MAVFSGRVLGWMSELGGVDGGWDGLGRGRGERFEWGMVGRKVLGHLVDG